jgi:hypothetical protein
MRFFTPLTLRSEWQKKKRGRMAVKEDSDAVLSRSLELVRRVCEGVAKELSNWKTSLVKKGWDSSPSLRSGSEWLFCYPFFTCPLLFFCHPEAEPKGLLPFLSFRRGKNPWGISYYKCYREKIKKVWDSSVAYAPSEWQERGQNDKIRRSDVVLSRSPELKPWAETLSLCEGSAKEWQKRELYLQL